MSFIVGIQRRLVNRKLLARLRFSFEFRHPSRFQDGAYRALAEQGAALCIYDFSGRLASKVITAEFVYLRLHGPEGPYQGQYRSEALSGWATDLSGWAGEEKEIYCYFDNDQAGYAAQDAMNLQEMVRSRKGGGQFFPFAAFPIFPRRERVVPRKVNSKASSIPAG